MRFGIHILTKGSLDEAPEKARQLGCRAFQVFCGNPRGWTKAPLDPERVARFRAELARTGLAPVVIHATYLINLAAPDKSIYTASVSAFIEELRRAALLGAHYYVIHCGSHKGAGEEPARGRIREALRRAFGEVSDAPRVLLENTAGTAHSMGTTFKDLAALLDGLPEPRAGLCFDTCHALAAGYEIRTAEGLAKTLDELDRTVGLSRLHCLHVNDSKGELNAHLDRHEHIGAGAIGAAGFSALFSERRLWDKPAILETPQDSPDADRRDLRRAVALAVAAGAASAEDLAAIPAAPLEKPKPARKSGRPGPRMVLPPALAAAKRGGRGGRRKEENGRRRQTDAAPLHRRTRRPFVVRHCRN